MQKTSSREVNEAICLVHPIGRVRSQQKKKREKLNPAARNTHRQSHNSTAIAANSRQRTTKEAQCVLLISPASVEAGFVETGHAHLSQSMIMRKKQADVHNRPTDCLNNGSLYALLYEEGFQPIDKKRPLTNEHVYISTRFHNVLGGYIRSKQ